MLPKLADPESFQRFPPSTLRAVHCGCPSSRQGSLTAFRSTAGSSLAVVSTFLLPITGPLGLGGPTGDLSSLFTIAGSPAYAMVGAAAVLSALYRAPLTGSLLLFELTKVCLRLAFFFLCVFLCVCVFSSGGWGYKINLISCRTGHTRFRG